MVRVHAGQNVEHNEKRGKNDPNTFWFAPMCSTPPLNLSPNEQITPIKMLHLKVRNVRVRR